MTESPSKPLARTPSLADEILPDVSLFGVALIWGVNIPIMKIGLEQVDVYVFNAVRLAVSALVLAVFAYREQQRRGWPQWGVPRRRIVLYAILVGAAYQLMFLMGIARTTAGNTALIISTAPMWTALLATIFLGEKLRRLAWIGLTIALAGTVIVAFQKGDVSAGEDYLLGNVIVLGAALMWAAGTVYSRPLLKEISPMQLSAAAVVIALPVHLLIALGSYQESLPALSSISLWMIILYSGVLSSGLAQPMWNFGVRRAGAAHAAIIQNAIPLIAIVAAWFSRGEAPTAAQLFGGALILLGLGAMRIARPPSTAAAVADVDCDAEPRK